MKSLTMTSALALIAAAAAPAFAQEAPAGAAAATAPDENPAEIVVTAQKRSERLQDVPLAVTVVSGDTLASQGRPNLEGAQYLVPSLNFLKSGTSLNQSLFLRGVGTSTFSIAGEPSVSTVIDGVVYSRPGEAFGDLIDIDQMEVLRGPQGTLFGKNASAGVINITTKQPTKEFGGYAEAGYYTKSEYRLRGAINAPLGENVFTRISGFYGDYDGNIKNLTTGNKVNGYRHYGGRAQVRIEPSSSARINLIADYHRNNDDCCAEVIATPSINGTTGAAQTSPAFTVLPTPKGSDTREITQNLVTRTKETGYGFSGQGDFDVGSLTLTTITAYRKYKNTEIRDGDWLPTAYIGFNQLHDFGPQTGDTFSQEVRLTSAKDQFFSYVLGAYYSRAKSERIFRRDDVVCTAATGAVIPTTTLTPCSSPLANPSTTPTGTADFGSTFKNFAVFGQGTLNFTESLRGIVGLRWTDDKLSVFHSRNTTLAGPGIQPSFPTTATGTGAPATQFRDSTSHDNLSGKAGLQYDFSHDVTGYATYSRGYKGPAYNVFYNLTATGTNVIAPETSNAYEIGLKNTLLDGRLILNLAAYYAKYHNFQANNPDLVAGVVVTRFTNAGDVSTRGVELDTIFRPAPDWNISGGLAYTDAHVNQFNLPPGAAATAVVPSGTPLGFAPKWKGSLGTDYRIRSLEVVDIFLGAQGSYQSKELGLFAADPIQRQYGTIKGYGLVNLSAGVGDKDGRYKLTAEVRNLFDQSFAAAITNGGPAGSYRYQIPRDADRYYGVTGRVNF